MIFKMVISRTIKFNLNLNRCLDFKIMFENTKLDCPQTSISFDQIKIGNSKTIGSYKVTFLTIPPTTKTYIFHHLMYTLVYYQLSFSLVGNVQGNKNSGPEKS